MPGLFDMLQPQDPLGQRTDLGGAMTSRGNAMIGMGMGLLSPYRAYAGESPYTNALQGWQTGSAADLASARTQQQAQMERARLALAQQQANREPEQIRLLRAAGIDPNSPEGRATLFPKQGTQWHFGQVPDPETERQYPYAFNPNTGEEKWPMGKPPFMQGGGGTPAAPSGATAPVVPGTTLYWPGQQATAEPSTTGTSVSPPAAAADLPPEIQNAPPSIRKEFLKKRADALAQPKEMPARAMESIEKADDLVAANKQVISTLNYAKTLSPKALSGPLTGASEAVGSAFPSLMSEETKNTMLLRNAVATNAVEQLRAIFGGNPTEGERKILIELQGSINAPDSVRQSIYDRAIVLAQNRLQENAQRAEQIRGGTYYKPSGGTSGQAPAASGGGVRRYNPQTGMIE